MNAVVARCLSLSAAALLLGPLAGCHAPAPATTPTSIVLRIPDYEAFVDNTLLLLRERDFQPDRVDRVGGLIVTKATTSGQWYEFWRVDSQGPYQQLESSMHTIQRTVTIRLQRLDGATSPELVAPEFPPAYTPPPAMQPPAPPPPAPEPPPPPSQEGWEKMGDFEVRPAMSNRSMRALPARVAAADRSCNDLSSPVFLSAAAVGAEEGTATAPTALNLTPAEPAAPLGGTYRVTVEVTKARYSAPSRQVTTSSGAIAIYSEKIPTTEGLYKSRVAGAHWVPLGRDGLLESYLMVIIADAAPGVEVLP